METCENFHFAVRRRAWAEIDLDVAENNFFALRDQLPEGTKLCCIVKADAYGHGAVSMAKLYETLGAEYLAVSNIEEALQLRENGIKCPVLILGYTPIEAAKLLADHSITQCVFSYEYGKQLADAAKASGLRVKIHIKLDTGMGRIGFLARKDGVDEMEKIIDVCQREELIPEGIFTHFAVADDESEEGIAFTKEQIEQFDTAIERLALAGISFEIRHCANSAAAVSIRPKNCNMVRLGLVLYGISPFQNRKIEGISPVMTLKTAISHKKELEIGESVSYGRRFVAPKKMTVATVPIGYGDGYWRSNGFTGGVMRLGEHYVPIIGSVCMDQTMLDVTDVPCEVGDEIIVFGADERCSAESIAHRIGTISYEVICSLNHRVPRCFLKHGKIQKWRDPIYYSDFD